MKEEEKGMKTVFEKVFQLSKHKTTAKTEIMAGITTFMTMAYILAVNPSILSAAGMDSTAVLLATALSSFIGTACMGLMANLPFALSAGMGLNAFLAYTVVLGMGYTWQVALLAVFVEGLIFIVLSLTNVREAIFNAIPLTLKRGVSVGIGLFICFIGLQNAGLAVDSSTLVTITSFTENFNTHGICALLALVGLFIMAALYIHHVRGAILLGILATWIIGMICQVVGIYVPDPANGFYTLFPTMALTDFSKLGMTFGQCFNVDFSNVGIVNFIIVVFSFLFVDIFDTLGTLIGVATKADMLDEKGRLPGIKPRAHGGRHRHHRRRCEGYFDYHYLCRVRFRRGCRRPARVRRADPRHSVPRLHVLCADLHGDSVLRDRSGADDGRLSDGFHRHRDSLRRG